MSRWMSMCALVTALCFVSSGCSPEVKKEMAEAGKGMADAAKETAGGAMEAAKSSVSDAMSKATEALASVEGGSDMLKQVTELFGKATSTIQGVKDEASATAALPELGKLTESFGSMTELYGKLPEAAKTAVAGVFQSALGELKPILEKVMAIPGVEAVLKPAVDALMEKLGTFKA